MYLQLYLNTGTNQSTLLKAQRPLKETGKKMSHTILFFLCQEKLCELVSFTEFPTQMHMCGHTW